MFVVRSAIHCVRS
ncbi:hypothetical protein LINPERPRIM_LOCUS21975 [Linum perenne]